MGPLDADVWALLRQCVAEFIGTFVLVLFTVLSPLAGVFAPVVAGLIVTALVYAYGHISLAVFNPSISLAFTVRPHLLSLKSMFLFILTQLTAGLLGAVCGWAMGGTFVPGLAVEMRPLGPIVASEFIGTFVLTSVALNAGTSADYKGNSFFGLAIGSVVVALTLSLGPVSGAVFNPAIGMISLLASLWAKNVPRMAWVYFVIPPVAAICATLIFRFMSPRDHAPKGDLMHGPIRNYEPVGLQ